MFKRFCAMALTLLMLLPCALPAFSAAPTYAKQMKASDFPRIIETIHPTEDVVIADCIANDFGADPTGVKDSTAAINKALRDCASKGGGTVYLPAGTYKVTRTISVPAFVTLRGDWIDPDTVEDPTKIENYGTVILSYQKSSTRTSESLFNIKGSAGVMGLTVYYPEQSIDKVQPYPFTFYTTGNGDGGYMLASVQDCTVINGYAGLGACVSESNAHEMFTVDNVKGTFLSVGAEVYNQADVGTWKSLTISPKYWANAAGGLTAAPLDKVSAYMRANAIGLKLGDLEWTEFANLTVESCKTGISIVKGKRIAFAGSLFDVSVTDCDIALDVRDLDDRWGMVIARATLEGSTYAIRNLTKGRVKMSDVKTVGKLGAVHKNTVIEAVANLDKYTVDYNRSPVKPNAILYTADIQPSQTTDMSAKLQAALDAVGKTGGILYLKPGIYRLDKPVTVPKGVQLRGASSVPTREQNGLSKGTLILSAYGLGTSKTPDEEVDAMPALITLSENSGVSGMRFYYTTNNYKTVGKTPYVIRGTGANVYAVNCSIVAAGNGIDFRGCDNHYIKKFVGACYYNTIVAGGKNGMIEGCLQNGNTFTRSGLKLQNWVSEGRIFEDLFPKLRRNSKFLTLEGAENEVVLNFFAYGVAEVAHLTNTKNVLLVNIGGDNIGLRTGLVVAENSTGTVVNMMRYNGKSYKADAQSAVDFYNRITINEHPEQNIVGGKNIKFQ